MWNEIQQQQGKKKKKNRHFGAKGLTCRKLFAKEIFI